MTKRGRTIADVAAEAGVSTATVSRALNGGTISPEARARVEAAARRLNYRRNDLARSLATGRTGVVGVLIPDVIGPLYARMARGIEEVLEPLGMHYMMVTDNRDLDQEVEAIHLLLARRVDALVVIGSRLDPDGLAEVVGDATPIVLIQPERDGGGRHTTIEIDNDGGIRAAVDHLVERGHRRIGHVSGLRRDADVRARALRGALAGHGLEPVLFTDGGSTEEGGVRAGSTVARSHREEGLSAVVCSNDRIAAGLYLSLRLEGCRVGIDVSVIGFDDLPWCPYLDPPLTTVRQPAEEMGRAAARHVLTALRDGVPAGGLRLPAELVPRDSVRDLRPAKEVSAI